MLVNAASVNTLIVITYILNDIIHWETIVGILTFKGRINYCLLGFMPEFSTDFDILKFHA